MIVVHHLNNSRSQRVLWLLEELDLPYEIKFYQRDPKTKLAPKELRAVHPLGKSPLLQDGEIVVAESGAIVEYLLDQYGKGSQLRPASATPERRRYNYFLHYAEGSLMPPLLLYLIFSEIPKRAPLLVRPVLTGVCETVKHSFVIPQIRQHAKFLDGELKNSKWFVGDELSAADIQMSFGLEALDARGFLTSEFVNLSKLVERMHARPGYKRALERGGPYNLLK